MESLFLKPMYAYKQLIFFDVESFITLHTKINKHINYCECIIDRNGYISYAHPSHVEASYLLYEYEYQKTRKEIDDEILSKGLVCDVLSWNNYMTNSISVWYDFMDMAYLGGNFSECYPVYNDAQFETLIKLTRARCISPAIMLEMKLQRRAKLYFKRFEKLSDSMKDQINSFAPRF